MNARSWWMLALIFLAQVAWTVPGRGEGRVELELLTDERVPITAAQEWLGLLSRAGIENFRIRSRGTVDQVGIEVRGTEAAPVYVVTAVITSGDEVVVPGARFRSTELARLARWLKDLAQQGPAGERGGPTAFGLDARQFQQVHDDLAQTVSFSTAGTARSEVVQRIAQTLKLPLRLDPAHLEAIGQDKVPEELSGLSSGTALAYVLRAPGLCLVPGRGAAGPEYTIVAARPELQIWPVGWPPEKPDRDVAPILYEFLNVNVQGVSVSDVLKALGPRLKLPMLLDHNAMARHGVQPEKAAANLPQSRTTYSLLLRKVLFQAGLKSEIRVDEAGHPFLWITTLKPL